MLYSKNLGKGAPRNQTLLVVQRAGSGWQVRMLSDFEIPEEGVVNLPAERRELYLSYFVVGLGLGWVDFGWAYNLG